MLGQSQHHFLTQAGTKMQDSTCENLKQDVLIVVENVVFGFLLCFCPLILPPR